MSLSSADRFEVVRSQQAQTAEAEFNVWVGEPFTRLSEHDVKRAFKPVNTKKTAGQDDISVQVLKLCANQLVPVFTMIFNLSLSQSAIPTCFKKPIIIPIPKKTRLHNTHPPHHPICEITAHYCSAFNSFSSSSQSSRTWD